MKRETLTFLLGKGITWYNLEMLFTDEKHYRAMKSLSNTEKLIFFLTDILEKSMAESAAIMKVTEAEAEQIKEKAVENFLKVFLEKERRRGRRA